MRRSLLDLARRLVVDNVQQQHLVRRWEVTQLVCREIKRHHPLNALRRKYWLPAAARIPLVVPMKMEWSGIHEFTHMEKWSVSNADVRWESLINNFTFLFFFFGLSWIGNYKDFGNGIFFFYKVKIFKLRLILKNFRLCNITDLESNTFWITQCYYLWSITSWVKILCGLLSIGISFFFLCAITAVKMRLH